MSNLNDPRVFFAAERTLLAWHSVSLALIAFGFLIERSGLLLQALAPQEAMARENRFTFWAGLVFILLGAFAASAAVVQYRALLRNLKPVEIPEGYRVHLGSFINLVVAATGVVWTVYLLMRGPGL